MPIRESRGLPRCCYGQVIEGVTVEPTLDPDSALIVCTAGENACPPEDVGGVPGYEEFLLALADPMHDEHDNLRTWIGYPFDPAALDLNSVNRLLATVKP